MYGERVRSLIYVLFVVISIFFLGHIIPLFFIHFDRSHILVIFIFFKYHRFYLICLLLIKFFDVLSFGKNLFPI